MSEGLEYRGSNSRTVVLVVPKQHVKTVKSALERAAQLDRTSKITTEPCIEVGNITAPRREGTQQFGNTEGKTAIRPAKHIDIVSINKNISPSTIDTSTHPEPQLMRIPTTISYPFIDEEILDSDSSHKKLNQIVDELRLGHLRDEITISYHTISNEDSTSPEKNPVRKALKEALDNVPKSILQTLNITADDLIQTFPEAYSLYKPMLLLPHNALSSPSWQTLLTSHLAPSTILGPIWKALATSVSATHIAINSPIPLQTSPQSPSSLSASPNNNNEEEQEEQENILRSPVNITPLYGDFGPPPKPLTLSHPSPQDFSDALWVSTTQNGIQQCWAPLYTMFSRGNIREKTRILNLPSVTSSGDAPCSVADLYAGIGYFAFSYRRGSQGRTGGIERVVCFELNAWSVEGLRRGAVANGWGVRVWREGDVPGVGAGEEEWERWRDGVVVEEDRRRATGGREGKEDFWVFQMRNERAAEVLERLGVQTEGGLASPVRHVNLGLLPTARLMWRTAARLVDVERGGWIHVHENVGMKEIESRTEEVRVEFQNMVDEFDDERGGGDDGGIRRKVQVQHVERVKMYAPGVVHCVFDVHINGKWDVE